MSQLAGPASLGNATESNLSTPDPTAGSRPPATSKPLIAVRCSVATQVTLSPIQILPSQRDVVEYDFLAPHLSDAGNGFDLPGAGGQDKVRFLDLRVRHIQGGPELIAASHGMFSGSAIPETAARDALAGQSQRDIEADRHGQLVSHVEQDNGGGALAFAADDHWLWREAAAGHPVERRGSGKAPHVTVA